MEDLKVCRVCLITDVKMYDIFSYDHYFGLCTGISLKDNMGLPKYACYECVALLKKFYFFREKCFKGQSVLFHIMSSTGQISYKDIAKLDRFNLKLTSTLSISRNVPPELCDEYKTIEICIKDEPFNAHVVEDDDINCDDDVIDYNESDDKFEIDTKDVKDENMQDAPMSSKVFSDEDDEPLSIHKSNKEKGKKKTVKKSKKREVKLESMAQEVEVEENVEDITDLLLEKTTPKRSRGRPPKATTFATKDQKPRRTQNTGGVDIQDIDLEEYVTVIKLSLKEQIEEVTVRQNSSNYLNAAFQCNLCYRGFIDTDAWKHHVQKHDPVSGDVECPVCKFRFKTKRDLQKHASNHGKKYACKSCSYVSKTTTQAKQHQRWHTGVTYKCQYCDEILNKWTSYLSHVRIKHPSEFICDVCGYSFVSKLGLTMHRRMMHKGVIEEEAIGSVAGGPYCAECDVKFISEEAYKRHMVTSAKHIESSDFQNGCRVCGEIFKTAEDLRVHHRKEHAKKRPKNYGKKPTNATFPIKCEHCSVEMENAREYWAHFRRAHPDKNYPIRKDYVCDICGKSFRGNAFLVYHKRTHTEERSFPCALCGKAFFNRANLLMHARTHSDARPYPCSVCLKAFKCKGALDRHFRSHTGVKPYECEVCGKAFGQSNSRKLHVRTVHLRQPAPYVSRARQERRARPPPPQAPAPAPDCALVAHYAMDDACG